MRSIYGSHEGIADETTRTIYTSSLVFGDRDPTSNSPNVTRSLKHAGYEELCKIGISKMAEACPGTTVRKLDWLASQYIREEAYTKALAELVNYHHRQPFSEHWGEGTTSSSDGQRFRASGRGEQSRQVNRRYGNEPGVPYYTHISDQYTPFYTKVIAANARDATHVLDGLLYQESDLRIEEHYTDTAGFTGHVFALCHLLAFVSRPASVNSPTSGFMCPARSAITPRSLR